jgi:hypothetical protein
MVDDVIISQEIVAYDINRPLLLFKDTQIGNYLQ